MNRKLVKRITLVLSEISGNKSSLVAVITDSAECNVAAKASLSEKFEFFSFLPCFANGPF